MKFSPLLIAASLIAGTTGLASAQTAITGAASGVVAPNSPRVLSNGDVAPAPSIRANGGVGATEVPYDAAQTRSGGPSGGNKTQTN